MSEEAAGYGRLESHQSLVHEAEGPGVSETSSVAAWTVAGVPWPDRLRWAARQLPLAEGAGAARLDAWGAALGDDTHHAGDGAAADPGRALARRLAWSGLSDDQARVAVSDVPSPTDPDWLPWFVLLRQSVQDHGARSLGARDLGATDPDDAAVALDWLATRESAMPEPARSIPFAALWWPGVEAVWAELAGAHEHLLAHVAPPARLDLQLGLLSRLSEASTATLTAHLSTDLTFGQRLLQRLGDPPDHAPRERFARTCRDLATGGLDDVLLDHPVLASLLGTAVRQWRAATVELLTRLARHRPELHELFGIPVEAELTGAVLSAGDRHQDGRSVAVLAFGDARVVYKPRDVRLEQLWWRVVDEVSRHAPGILRAARVLTADDGHPYGFAEFVDHRPATSPDELGRFYRSAGGTLALLFALSATDCHYENLVASGEHLVLIDAEALAETRDGGDAAGPAGGARGTVLQVGMLPSWLWLEGSRTALDVSALGCTPESIRRRTTVGWRAVNTDAMCRGPLSIQQPHPASLPTPPGMVPDLAAHVEDLVEGFRTGYRAVMAAQARLLSEVLAPAAGLRRRLILRPTYVYAILLAQSCEPAALRSAVDRGMVLERLARLHLGADEAQWPLLEAEQRALSRLDVPLFETDLVGGRTSWVDGSLEGWPEDDALAAVRTRITGMDEADLRWQERLIRSAMAARDVRPSAPASSDGGRDTRRSTSGEAHGWREGLVERIRGQVVADALPGDGTVTWMTLAMLPDGEHVTVQRLGPGLYDGAIGVAIALDRLGEPDLARSALRPVLDSLDPADPDRARRLVLGTGLGWSGTGGYLRALRLLEGRGLVGTGEADTAVAALVSTVSPDAIAGDRRLDVMNGAAGLACPLAAEIRRRPSCDPVRERCRLLLDRAADHLAARQVPGGAWTTLPASAPLTGLAHGAAGIALALAEAALILDEPPYLDAAVRGLAYEASVFTADAGNWPDYREGSSGGFMLGWCAGAPGIALTRMRMLELAPDHPDADRWARDLDTAAETTARSPLLARDHLCCGNLGRAAVLRVLGARTGDAAWESASREIAVAVVTRAGAGLPRTLLGDAPADVIAVPGLMTGLGGAGALLADEDVTWLGGLLL